MTEHFKKKLNFFLEIDKVKNISIADGSRRENRVPALSDLTIVKVLAILL